MNSRLKNLYAKLSQQNLDGLICSHPANVTYLTECPSREAYLLASPKQSIYFTDFRYLEEAKKRLKSISLKQVNGSVFGLIAAGCNQLKLKRVGFEERYLPYAEYKKISQGLKAEAKLVPTHSLVEELRQIKSRAELQKIKKATQITVSALKFIRPRLKPGKKEIEVAAEIERFIRYQGASNAAFEMIIASGRNGAFPHHLTSQRRLKNREPVWIDLGVEYQGYKSDLTRVFFLGKISPQVARIYDIVRLAQDKAIQGIKPGVAIDKIDRLARQYIAQQGYGGFFGHSLGHGIGLEVHEAPHISGKESQVLQPGMVFTIEPAIYLPGKFGIRIEDMVLVTRKGVEVLSGNLNK